MLFPIRLLILFPLLCLFFFLLIIVYSVSLDSDIASSSSTATFFAPSVANSFILLKLPRGNAFFLGECGNVSIVKLLNLLVQV